MTEGGDAERCDLCKRGKVIARNEVLTFQQRTSKGYISCQVTIPVATCDVCGAKSWDEAAEATIEEAVRRALEEPP